MKILHDFWVKICTPLDGFLWHRNISHPIIRPVLRNVILASGLFLLLGGALFLIFPGVIWFGAGLACMTWIFWGWTKFFLKADPNNYSALLMRALFLNFALRLLLIVFLLYVAIIVCGASPISLIAGMITGAFLGLATYAWQLRHHA